MSLNIQTSMSSSTKSLSDQGAFRNSMYQQDEKKNKKTIQEPVKVVHEDVSNQFVKNDKIRMKSTGLNFEISHVEEEISIAQTVEQALADTQESLLQMQELVDLVCKETEFNSNLRNADQEELEKLINRINKIADETSYGQNYLLDGSCGVKGVANGKFLEFVSMNPNPIGSPLNGYEIEVFEVATRSELKGGIPLTQEIIDNSEILIFEVNGVSNRFVFKEGLSVSDNLSILVDWLSEIGIPIEMIENTNKILQFRHLQYGSVHCFGVSSLTPGIISEESQKIIMSKPGIDIKGSINGIPCVGHGQFLSAPDNEEDMSKLTIRYTGNEVPEEKIAGFVSVSQNGFQFITGSNESSVEKLSLKSIHASNLGKKTENISGFNSLQDIFIKNSQSVKDSLCIIKKSLSEVSAVKEKVEIVCGKTLKSNIINLQKKHFKLVDSQHNLQNSGNAKAFAELTKNKITENTGRSSIAQANQNPESVLTLLK